MLPSFRFILAVLAFFATSMSAMAGYGPMFDSADPMSMGDPCRAQVGPHSAELEIGSLRVGMGPMIDPAGAENGPTIDPSGVLGYGPVFDPFGIDVLNPHAAR